MRPALLTQALIAAAISMPAHADERIREIAYDPSNVIRLDACLGYQTMIEFGADEKIENVGVGDSSQWLVVPNARANMLFIRPAFASTHSNMTVATDRRRYAFDLNANPTQDCTRGKVVYYIHFTYEDAIKDEPRDAPAAPTPPPPDPLPPVDARNALYSFSGSQDNVPLRVFDDGIATFFSWSAGMPTPAVYAVARDQSETLVSFSARGEYLMANVVAPQFRLRSGQTDTTLFNDGYTAPKLDALSPKLRPEPKREKFLGIF